MGASGTQGTQMAAERRIPPTSRLLGEYLDCGAEEIEDALSRQLAGMHEDGVRRIGELLLNSNAISMEQLLDAVQAQRVDRLRACPLFSALDDEELASIAAVFQEVSVDAGDQFISQDENDPTLYVIAAGVCKVLRVDDGGQEIPLARVFPGEPVGEMGYFAGGVRSASVCALDSGQLLRASYEDLTDCFESIPGVAAAFMEVITQRLRQTNLLYQENQFHGATSSHPLDHLSGHMDLSGTKELEDSIDRLLVRIMHSASRLTDADRATLFLIDPETGELWSKVAQGAEVKEIRVPAGAGVVGWTIEHNELVNIEEAYEDDRFNPEVDRRTGYRTHTILCAPVRGQGNKVLGAVQAINKNIGVFNEEDESLLRAFSAQTAIAVENINLFRDVVRDYRRMTMLLDTATIASQVEDLRELSLRLGPRLAEHVECERGEFLLLDAERKELWGMEEVDDELVEERFAVDGSAASHALDTGQTVNIRDAYDDERFDTANDRQRGGRTRSLLIAPVINRAGAVRGVVQVTNRVNDVFDDDDADTLRLVAAQLGVTRLLD